MRGIRSFTISLGILMVCVGGAFAQPGITGVQAFPPKAGHFVVFTIDPYGELMDVMRNP
jgi:hypothetical protein